MLRSIALGVLIAAACGKSHRAAEPAGKGSAAVSKASGSGTSAVSGLSAISTKFPKDAPPKYRTDDSGWNLDPRVTGVGKTFMVASENELATRAGRDILAGGGNAVDAAVATAFALAVVHPSAGNLAGGGFAVIHVKPGDDRALDFRETAPAAATETMFLDASGNPTRGSLIGDRASGVPGSVAGLWELHQKLGKRPWREVIAPAIAYATDGFAVDERLHGSIVRLSKLLGANPASAALWMPGGKPRATGEVVKNPELAAVLQRIAQHGADGFYQGPTAEAIVAEMTAGKGLITAKDLAGYKAIWREPIRYPDPHATFVAMPPPSSGGVVIAMTAEMLGDITKLRWHSFEHVHRLVEVWRRAFAARNELLGDPAYVKDMPVAKMLSKEYAAKLAATIGPRATPSLPVAPLIEGDHTTNLCVVDAAGMAVALTTTINTAFGNGVTVSGFLLNNEMDDFASKPGTPNVFGLVQGRANRIEPGKRMLSSMAPTIVLDPKGAVVLLAGAGGGPRIITAVWQTISNVLDFGMPLDRAVAAPRLHHQHLPDEVRLEAESVSEADAKALIAAGYKLSWSATPREFGAVTAIARTPQGWSGTADPRGGGAAMGD